MEEILYLPEEDPMVELSRYHLRNAVDEYEMGTSTKVAPKGGPPLSMPKPTPETLGHYDLKRFWISRESHNDVEFVALLKRGEYDYEASSTRWLVIRGGCDYTGWGCQSGADATGFDLWEHRTMAMSATELERLGL